MKYNSTNPIAIIFFTLVFTIAIALTPISFSLAGTVKSNSADTAQQAAQEVLKDTGAKEQFGQSENGDRLIDKAQAKASQKLTELSQTEETTEQPNSKKQFLKNLQGQ